jgi:hypothetical protein
MKFKPWFLIIFFLLAFIIYVSIPDNSKVEKIKSNDDSTAIVNARAQKDEAFRTLDDSPILDKSNFRGLNYFPFDSKWKIIFLVNKNQEIKEVDVKMTDGSNEKMVFFAIINAEINGLKVSLDLFQHSNGNFFLAFKDQTAPKETYGGGRYIDILADQLNGNKISVDFNQAYFPYCAYKETYACPVPPKRNVIALRIPAGEKD